MMSTSDVREVIVIDVGYTQFFVRRLKGYAHFCHQLTLIVHLQCLGVRVVTLIHFRSSTLVCVRTNAVIEW